MTESLDWRSDCTYLGTRRSAIEHHNTPKYSSLCPISHHIGDTMRVLLMEDIRSMTKRGRQWGYAPWIGLGVYWCIPPCLVDTVFVESVIKLEQSGGNLVA